MYICTYIIILYIGHFQISDDTQQPLVLMQMCEINSFEL